MALLKCLNSITGFILLIATDDPRVKYVGTFLAASGIYPNVPQGVAWNGNNIGGSTKRSVGIAMHVGFGNLGGVIAGFIYQSQDAPRYRRGHGTLIGTLTMSLALSVFMTIWLRRENSKRDKDTTKHPDLYTSEEKSVERHRGDNASFFRYTV